MEAKKIACQNCKNPLTSQDHAAYGHTCEECWVGFCPASSLPAPQAVKRGCNHELRRLASTIGRNDN